MNTSQDWDVIWRWQWFRRALWQPYFGDPSHPEGRPARSAPIWIWLLKQYGSQRVIDSNCGIGLRAILLHEAGFDIVGADGSAVAIGHASELAEARDLTLPFHHCSCQNIAELFGQEFDAVVNDSFARTLTRAELRFAAFNFASILKPGGIFVFTGADQWLRPEDHETVIEHAWQSAPRFQLRNDFEHGNTHMTLVVARDKTKIGVVENYLFVIRDEAGPRLETAAICNSVQWTWDDYQNACREAGFTSLESVKVPVGTREHTLNVATK